MYTNPYSVNPFYNPSQLNQQVMAPQPNILPPQQIISVKGRESLSGLRMAPNSSVLIADEENPIVWKCTSDGLGNVSYEGWDISPHKDQKTKEEDALAMAIRDLDTRIKRLEDTYEESTVKRNTSESHVTEYRSNQTSVGNAQKHGKPTSNDKSNG